MAIKENIRNVQEQMKIAALSSQRSFDEVTLIAVTKSVTPVEAQEVVDNGVFHLAENRPESLLEKQQLLMNQQIKWHYIGSLQTRKVKQVIHAIDYFHALDRMSLAVEINKRATKKISCFVQVNVTGEERKHGLSPEALLSFIKDVSQFTNIRVIGLMTMAAYGANETELRKTFSALKKSQQQVQLLQLDSAPCTELSMGMSGDFPIAIEEGSSFIRVGTKLFEKDESK